MHLLHDAGGGAEFPTTGRNSANVVDFVHLMANVLPDREIKKLLNHAILDGSESCVRINSYEVRLGHRAKFDSTGEELDIPTGHFLEIEPGEFVTVGSMESFDFSAEKLKALGKPNGLFAWITPTTTMMREGFLFASTKVDPGYKGQLNWGIRNSSVKTVKLQQGEHLFKLTVMELSDGERPDKFYGEDRQDQYQGTSGIRDSARLIPAHISENKIVRRTQRKLDPIKQLTQAGYPYNHIGTELIELQGKFEIVSRDVAAMQSGFADLKRDLGNQIGKESETLSASISTLSEKIDKGISSAFAEQFHLYFDQRMQRIIGVISTLAAFAAALYKGFIESAPQRTQFYYLLGLGALLLIATLTLTRSPRPKKRPSLE